MMHMVNKYQIEIQTIFTLLKITITFGKKQFELAFYLLSLLQVLIVKLHLDYFDSKINHEKEHAKAHVVSLVFFKHLYIRYSD